MRSILTFSIHQEWLDQDIYPEDEGKEPSAPDECSLFSRLPITNNNKVYVYNCLFANISSRAFDYQPDQNGKSLIELSTFDHCITTTQNQIGGCIYQSDGSFVINRCCGRSCYGSMSGQFIYTTVHNNYKNNVLDTAVSLSYNTETDQPSESTTLYLRQGSVLASNLNISYNKCKSNTAIFCRPHTDGTCKISSSTIKANQATGQYGRIIIIYTSSKNNSVEHCNIFDNVVEWTSIYGVLSADGESYQGVMKIIHCCILNPNSPKIFSVIWNAVMELIDCTVDESHVSSTASIITSNWSPIKSSFINALLGTATGDYCKAKYETFQSSGLTLIPETPTPKPTALPTPEKTPEQTPLKPIDTRMKELRIRAKFIITLFMTIPLFHSPFCLF